MKESTKSRVLELAIVVLVVVIVILANDVGLRDPKEELESIGNHMIGNDQKIHVLKFPGSQGGFRNMMFLKDFLEEWGKKNVPLGKHEATGFVYESGLTEYRVWFRNPVDRFEVVLSMFIRVNKPGEPDNVPVAVIKCGSDIRYYTPVSMGDSALKASDESVFMLEYDERVKDIMWDLLSHDIDPTIRDYF